MIRLNQTAKPEWLDLAPGLRLLVSALEGTIAGAVNFGDRTAAIFQGAYDAAVAIWGSLPGVIGDFAFQAANGLISGVEAMLNGVATRINNFINGLNAALALLPEWATGEGGVRIGTLDFVDLARIGNPFEGAAEVAEAAGAAAGRPLASWQALRDAVSGSGAQAGWFRPLPSQVRRARKWPLTSHALSHRVGGACDGIPRGAIPRQHQPRGAGRSRTADASGGTGFGR